MVEKFALIKLYVADHAKMVEFYCQVLGLRVLTHAVDGEGEDEHEESILGFGAGVGSAPGADLIIVQEYHRPPPVPGEVAPVYWVQSVEAVAAAVAECGGSIAIPISEDPRYNTRSAYFEDPEGHRFQVIE